MGRNVGTQRGSDREIVTQSNCDIMLCSAYIEAGAFFRSRAACTLIATYGNCWLLVGFHSFGPVRVMTKNIVSTGQFVLLSLSRRCLA